MVWYVRIFNLHQRLRARLRRGGHLDDGRRQSRLPGRCALPGAGQSIDRIKHQCWWYGDADRRHGECAICFRQLSLQAIHHPHRNRRTRRHANTLSNFFNSGGALPPNFVGIFGLTGNHLATALSQVSGEAATGAQEGAFQFMGQFLNLMLDPFVDGRGGAPGIGGTLGFAPEREALPEDIAHAYAKAMKAPVYKAPPVAFEQPWNVWAGGFGGANRTAGDAAIGSHDLAARVAGGAARLDYHLTRDHGFGLCARWRRHEMGPGARAGRRQEPRLPGRRLRRGALGAGLSGGLTRRRQSVDVDRPLRRLR
jgi:hypothetical protein